MNSLEKKKQENRLKVLSKATEAWKSASTLPLVALLQNHEVDLYASSLACLKSLFHLLISAEVDLIVATSSKSPNEIHSSHIV